MTNERRVAGIILAAGNSRRMGRNKLLLDVAGEPLIRRVTRTAFEASLSPILLVVRSRDQDHVAALRGLDYVLVTNTRADAGMGSSLAAGFAEVPADAKAAIVLLADMPLVSAQMVETLVSHYQAAGDPLIVASRYGTTIAPPHLFDRRVFHEAERLAGEGRGAALMERFSDRTSYVDWAQDKLSDLDSPEDYARLQAN